MRIGIMVLALCACGCSINSGGGGSAIYVSKLGDNTDGSSWRKAFTTIQAALNAVLNDNGGHRIVVRPDTYFEANLYSKHKGAADAYNSIIGDCDGKLGSGAMGWVVIDSGENATALAGKWQLSGQLPTLITDCGFDEYRIWAYAENLPKGVTHTGAFQKNSKTTSRYWHPSILTNGQYTPTKPTDYGPDLFNAFLIDFMSRSAEKSFFAYYPTPLTHGPHDPTPDPAKSGEKTPTGLESNLEYLDHQVGQLIAALDRLGLRENTIVIFTADNGTAGDGKGRATELGARVPMIVNCPGKVKAGVVSDELVDLSDVFATLADFSGASPPAGHVIDGKSFAPVLRGESGKGREWIFSAIRSECVLRDKRWLLEGDGRFFDCGDKRDHEGYRDVTGSKDADVVAARQRFDKILKNLPAPPEQEMKQNKGQRRRARVNDE